MHPANVPLWLLRPRVRHLPAGLIDLRVRELRQLLRHLLAADWSAMLLPAMRLRRGCGGGMLVDHVPDRLLRQLRPVPAGRYGLAMRHPRRRLRELLAGRRPMLREAAARPPSRDRRGGGLQSADLSFL